MIRCVVVIGFKCFSEDKTQIFFLLHLSSEVTWWVMWWGGRAKSIEPSCPMITYISSTLPNHTYYAFRGCSNDLQRHFIITRCKASEKTRDVDYHQQMHQEISERSELYIKSEFLYFRLFSAFSEHSHCYIRLFLWFLNTVCLSCFSLNWSFFFWDTKSINISLYKTSS